MVCGRRGRRSHRMCRCSPGRAPRPTGLAACAPCQVFVSESSGRRHSLADRGPEHLITEILVEHVRTIRVRKRRNAPHYQTITVRRRSDTPRVWSENDDHPSGQFRWPALRNGWKGRDPRLSSLAKRSKSKRKEARGDAGERSGGTASCEGSLLTRGRARSLCSI